MYILLETLYHHLLCSQGPYLRCSSGYSVSSTEHAQHSASWAHSANGTAAFKIANTQDYIKNFIKTFFLLDQQHISP